MYSESERDIQDGLLSHPNYRTPIIAPRNSVHPVREGHQFAVGAQVEAVAH